MAKVIGTGRTDSTIVFGPEQFESPLPIRSITYIEDTNEYAVRTVSVGFKYDSNFNLINKFPFVMGMNFGFDIGRQGWAYYKNHIYYTNWSWIKYGGDGSNSIYIYDYEGHRKDALYKAKKEMPTIGSWYKTLVEKAKEKIHK